MLAIEANWMIWVCWCPDVNGFVQPARGDIFPIRRPGYRIDNPLMSTIGSRLITGYAVPNLYRSINACRGNLPPVRRPGQRSYQATMALIGKEVLKASYSLLADL